MKQKTCLLAGVMLATGLAMSAPTAWADQIADTSTQTSFGPTATNWGNPSGTPPVVDLKFNGFNSSLGPLQSVQLTVTEELSGSVSGTNTSGGTVTTSFSIQNTGVVVNSSAGINISAVDLQATPRETIPANAPNNAYGPFNISGSHSASQTFASNLAFFENPYTLTTSDTGLESLSGGGGNINAQFTDVGSVSVTALYTYGTSVPEPGSLLLLGTGLMGLAMVMARRRWMV